MNYASCRASSLRLRSCCSSRSRYILPTSTTPTAATTTRPISDRAILRGLRASPTNIRRGDTDNDTTDGKYVPLSSRTPKAKPEQYPDYFIPTSSAYPTPSTEDRQFARKGLDDSSSSSTSVPPPPPLVRSVDGNNSTSRRGNDGEMGGTGAVTASPRRDNYRKRYEDDSLNTPSRMNVRRHIPKIREDSEYIYGTSVVESALQSERRKLYRFYLYAGGRRTPENRERDLELMQLAKKMHPECEIIIEYDLGNLDSMTYSRAHNPLEKIPILGLGPVSPDLTKFDLVPAQHTENPKIKLNDLPRFVRTRTEERFPFIVMLDEILDPGNLGAIVRSAYYLGADAVVVSSRNSAPLSAVAQKSSAGATEWLPVYEYTNSTRFMDLSKENGWIFYAAVPPVPEGHTPDRNYVNESMIGNPLRDRPCCLILGTEGDGLRPFLAAKADFQVTIEKGKGTCKLVDSLNVSVATAILCDRFMHPPVVPHFVIRHGKVKKVMVVEGDDIEEIKVTRGNKKKKVGKETEVSKKQVRNKVKIDKANLLFDLSVDTGRVEEEGGESGVEVLKDGMSEEGVRDSLSLSEVIEGGENGVEVEGTQVEETLEGPHLEKREVTAAEVGTSQDPTTEAVDIPAKILDKNPQPQGQVESTIPSTTTTTTTISEITTSSTSDIPEAQVVEITLNTAEPIQPLQPTQSQQKLAFTLNYVSEAPASSEITATQAASATSYTDPQQ